MKQLFHIENSNSDNGQLNLSLRFGEKHGSFAICDKPGSVLYELAYTITDVWNENELIKFFTAYPSLNNSFYQVQVVYDFPQSTLISSKAYKQEDAGLLLKALGSNTGNTIAISELIAEWQLYNVYAVPKDIREWVKNKFPAAEAWHQYSRGVRNINAATANGSLLIDFGRDIFTVIAAKRSKFLLAQTFEYSTPGDVLYYLLKICQQFSLSQQQVQLELSGLVDKQSSLFMELRQYFIHVEFREASWNIGSDYPAHFFTSLNDLAKCAL